MADAVREIAAPAIIVGAGHDSGAQRVVLNIPQHREQMCVVLDNGKGFA